MHGYIRNLIYLFVCQSSIDFAVDTFELLFFMRIGTPNSVSYCVGLFQQSTKRAMARFLTLTAIVIVFEIVATSDPNSTVALNSLRDPKHRTELVDEAFSEQKDVLLEMLEAKLKEVKDKKKKKRSLEKSDLKLNSEQKLCDTLSKDKSLVMRANGISNVGIVNILMNHGASGKGLLNFDADGISNVGRAHLELGMEGSVNVPGISNSLVAVPSRFNAIFCDNQELKEALVPDSPDIASKDFDLEETSLRRTDVNNTMTDINSTKSDSNDTDNVANATGTAATNAGTAANATDTANAVPIDTTVDTNDIDVSNITATVGKITTKFANSVTASAPENTVTVPNNTVPK